MISATSNATDYALIEALIDHRVAAVRAKDLDGLLANYAPNVLSFDVLNPLRSVGSDAVRTRAEDWFASYQGPIGYEIRDLSIEAGNDVAFCTFLYRVTGTLNDGGEVDMWVRATVCYRKVDGRWTVTHEHDSVPFDVESGKASLDLRP